MKKPLPIALAAVSLAAALLAGCDGTAKRVAADNAGAASAGGAIADDPFIGRWAGPEGLYFQVTEGGDDGRYRIMNRWTLDDEASFSGRGDGDMLSFTREGEPETARLGTGADTGFKWLSGKKACLIVKPGVEGYCRD